MLRNIINYLPSILVILGIPFVSYAQDFTWINSAITAIGTVLGNLIAPLAGLALLMFVWGLVKFIMHADNEQEHENGKQLMVWGVIALFVIVSVWGLVKLLQEIVGVNSSSTGINAPKIL